MSSRLTEIFNQHKQGRDVGIYSVCSANSYVLAAAMRHARTQKAPLLIESTSNQVDQFGGYSGMTPAEFVEYVKQIADSNGFPFERIVLGGDHLGPNVWQKLKTDRAMHNAENQITAYVRAGYKKIHLDSSMALGDDNPGRLDVSIVAERAARLCAVAEAASENTDNLYVIGSDVPIPGGARDDLNKITVSPVAEIANTLLETKNAFFNHGLQDAWERVIAVVVQPGVEFSDSGTVWYDHDKAKALSYYIESVPKMVYEAHSTDYQKSVGLKKMVEDHFAILKVGPWLTFALREALFALELIEREWLGFKKGISLSCLQEIILKKMAEQPAHWMEHYHGSKQEVTFACKYSQSDRIRYYWGQPDVIKAIAGLIENLKNSPAPYSVLNQFLPIQAEKIVDGRLANDPNSIITDKITEVLNKYSIAVDV